MPPVKRKKENPIVPVTILTGFLGSGKTTLLNHILNDPHHGLKFAVIENEVGDVNVDEKVLSNRVNEEIVEVMNGCLCCSFRYDLVEALETLYAKVEQFDGVLIETTGLADPAPVVQTFFINEDVKQCYRLDSVVTVVDAVHILDRIRERKPEGTVNEAVAQLAFADKIILNKTDLVPKPADANANKNKDANNANENNDANDANDALDKIEAELRAVNPTAAVVRTSYSQINPKELLHVGAFDLQRILQRDAEFLTTNQKPTHDTSVQCVALAESTAEVNRSLLEAWIQRLIRDAGGNLYRYKGVIAVRGMDSKYVFQGVGMLWHGAFQGRWRKKEIRETRFVFIGKNLDEALLRSGFQACRVTQDLRFSVGTVVDAKIGSTFQNGKIVRQWDKGNAYRIRLRTGKEVWAPLDIDEYVRTPKESETKSSGGV